MSIESKHAYRFGYLKSEHWKTVRLEALVREKGKCQVCGEESVFNDAHHVWYPENIQDTKERQLVVLCRPCHEFLHVMLPECKTNDEEVGRAHWIKFRNAIEHWRIAKQSLLAHPTEGFVRMRELGAAYDALKKRLEEQHSIIQQYESRLGKPPPQEVLPRKQTIEEQVGGILLLVKRLSKSVKSEKEAVADKRVGE